MRIALPWSNCRVGVLAHRLVCVIGRKMVGEYTHPTGISTMFFRLLAVTTMLCASLALADDQTPTTRRIVFLGDSITDGNTYPLLVQQAIREAKLPVPECFNAGIGGDTSEGMLKRLDRDVFSHHPTVVTISAGINDRFPSETFAKNMTAIVDAVQAYGATPILLTTSIVRDKSPERQARLDGYNAAIRQLAQQRKLPLAEVYQLMDRQPDAVGKLLVEDGVHPNYLGQSLIARAVLNALGHETIPLPPSLTLEIFPGVIRQWQMRAAAKSEAELDAQSVAKLVPGPGFATLNLPGRPAADPADWKEQERQCGFAMDIAEQVGKGERFFGIATVTADHAKPAVLNTGADLKAVWLNGQQVYKNTGWMGFHACKEQIPVHLAAGVNQLVIDTGGSFFLSLTETDSDKNAAAR